MKNKSIFLFILVLLILPFCIAYTSDYLYPITYSIGDLRYCLINGDCTIRNLNVTGNTKMNNITSVNYNITDSFFLRGYLVNNTDENNHEFVRYGTQIYPADVDLGVYSLTSGHLFPKTPSDYDIGSLVKQWRNLYLNGAAYISSFTIFNGVISSSTGSISFDNEDISTTGTITSPTISGLIPYTGATTTPDLGVHGLTTTGKIISGNAYTTAIGDDINSRAAFFHAPITDINVSISDDITSTGVYATDGTFEARLVAGSAYAGDFWDGVHGVTLADGTYSINVFNGLAVDGGTITGGVDATFSGTGTFGSGQINGNLSVTGNITTNGIGINTVPTSRYAINMLNSPANGNYTDMQLVNSLTTGQQEIVMGRVAGEQFVFGVYNSAYPTAAWRKGFLLRSDSGMSGGITMSSNAKISMDIRDRTAGVSPPHFTIENGATGADYLDMDYFGNWVLTGNISVTETAKTKNLNVTGNITTAGKGTFGTATIFGDTTNNIGIGIATTNTGNYGVAIGYSSTAGDRSFSSGYYATSTTNAFAVGYGAYAGTSATSAGYGTYCSGSQSTCIGYSAYSPSLNGIAIGTGVNATATGAVGIGNLIQNSLANSFAIGWGSISYQLSTNLANFTNANIITQKNVTIGQLINLASITQPTCGAGYNGSIIRNESNCLNYCNGASWSKITC